MLTNISRRALLAGLSCSIAGPAAGYHRTTHSKVGRTEPTSAPVEPTTDKTGANAIHSDAFVESISINTHLNWRTTVWGNPAWRRPLADLGVRYIRTMMGISKPASDDLKYLYDAAGIRACVLVSRFSSGQVYDNAKTLAYINYIRDQIGPEKVIAIEGPNEPNKSKTTGWEIRTRKQQQLVYDHAKTQPALAHLPVLAPSIYKRRVDDYAEIGDLTGMADVTNLHYYTNGTKPTDGIKDTTIAPMDDVIADAQAMVPGAPVWVTEYGHQVRDKVSERKPYYLSPLASAKYGLRGMAEFFKRGIRRIMWYTLIDDYSQNDNQFGLLAYSDTAFLKPRQSYFALQRLIGIMADPGPAFVPKRLVYKLSGDLTDVNHILFQKRDGRYLLMIWHDATSWDRKTATDINVPPRKVTLTLGTAAKLVKAYQPTMSDTPTILARSSTTASLQVPDHVQVVEITP